MSSAKSGKAEKFDPFGLLGHAYLHFGNAIERVRKALELSQGEFGAMLEGFSQSNIARYESGETEPPLDFWRKFARGCGLNLTWCITGEGNPYEGLAVTEGERAKVQHVIRSLYADTRRRGFYPLQNEALCRHLGLCGFYQDLIDRQKRYYMYAEEEEKEGGIEELFSEEGEDLPGRDAVEGGQSSAEPASGKGARKAAQQKEPKRKGRGKKKPNR